MKKIFLEMERLRNPFSGLGQFCWHLGKEFSQMPPHSDFNFTFYLPENQQFNFGSQIHYQSVSKLHKVFPVRGKYDIWHCLHQDSKYLPNRKDTKLIITVHDLNFLERDDYSNLHKQLQINTLQKKIDRSSAITYISEFTKKTVQQNLTIPPNVIEKVIYNGNNISNELLENNRKTFQPSRPEFKSEKLKYIFSIGIIQAKKNFHVLLPILQKYQDLSWFIAGDTSGEYAKKIKDLAKEIDVFERVHFLGTVEESEKYWLYENCEAFLFPSLSEGFGLPVIEAMTFGKPVFISRLTSLPEIGGNEAYYFDDFSPENIVNSFEKGMKDFYDNPNKIEKLKRRASEFSWAKAAKEYLEVYLNLCEG